MCYSSKAIVAGRSVDRLNQTRHCKPSAKFRICSNENVSFQARKSRILFHCKVLSAQSCSCDCGRRLRQTVIREYKRIFSGKTTRAHCALTKFEGGLKLHEADDDAVTHMAGNQQRPQHSRNENKMFCLLDNVNCNRVRI